MGADRCDPCFVRFHEDIEVLLAELLIVNVIVMIADRMRHRNENDEFVWILFLFCKFTPPRINIEREGKREREGERERAS